MGEQAYTVTCSEAEIGRKEYCDRFVDPPRFLAFCRECGSYGKVWSCPPYDFSVEELWERYDRLRLFSRKIIYSPELRERRYDQDEIKAPIPNPQ